MCCPDLEFQLHIGVLALQGAFEEHAALLQKLGAKVTQVRLPNEFEGLDGIVLPGGESTAMALIGERWGVFPCLKRWVAEGRPVWGTCAGLILLSNHALMTKSGGQSLVGGLDVEVCRNYFGAQVSSFEVPLDTSALTKDVGTSDKSPQRPYPAVFIRAPAILEAGTDVQVLAKVCAYPCSKARDTMRRELQAEDEATGAAVAAAPVSAAGAAGAGAGGAAAGATGAGAEGTEKEAVPEGGEALALRASKRRRLAAFLAAKPEAVEGRGGGGEAAAAEEEEAPEVTVAVRRGNILATAFHPELTDDARWHQYFLRMVREAKAVAAATGGGKPGEDGSGAAGSP